MRPTSLSQNWILYFNSIKVRLELSLRSERNKSVSDFNSIKVRLELRVLNTSQSNMAFQFHKGTIRTRVSLACQC